MANVVAPRVACVDLDTFFVSVERLLDPSLVGRPVVVGGRKGSRGVVTSASYEVRALGVRSGMPMAEAVRLAPDAAFVPTRHATYGPYAAQVKSVLERWCPMVRTASIDEFFLDFSGCERLYARPDDADADATIARTVRAMRAAIQAEVKLPASAGIGVTRAVAKMASGRAKPAGVWLVRAGEERAFVAPMSVRKLPGIGPVAEARLAARGVTTLGQLLAVRDDDPDLGNLAALLRDSLDGPPGVPGRDRPAFQEHDASAEGSLSNERTFFADVGERQAAEDALRALVERVTWRLRNRRGLARTISLKIRFSDFTTITRGQTVPPTCAEREVWRVARALLAGAWSPRARGPTSRLRLLGVQLSNLIEGERQLPLFPEERPRAGRAIDAVRARFGYDAIRLGALRDREADRHAG